MSQLDGTVGVLGAGAMGAGIAQVAAAAGHSVVVVDASGDALARARATLEAAMERDVAKGRRAADDAAALLGRVRFHGGGRSEGMGVFAGCTIVIEAIVEQLATKREVFARLDAAVGPECVLATNTSSLSVAAIASACAHSDRVLGVHFFNPAPLMPLVEIIPWLRTAPEVTAATRARIDGWGKVTVLATDTPGFIVNRVARPFYGEGLRIHDEGIADAPTIDWALREIGGFRMGPFELMDLIGLDVNLAVTRSVFAGFFFDPRYKPSITQERRVEAGMLGRKTGQGFYDYREGAQRPAPVTDTALGRRVTDRVVALLINEAVDAVHWRVASAADIDLAMTKGVNYPRGLLAWGRELGFDEVLARVRALHDEYGEDRYRPSPLLKRLARHETELT